MKSIYFESVKDALEYINLSKEKGYVLHAPVDKIMELSKNIKDNVVLCSTAGEHTSKGYKDGVVTGFEYDLNQGSVVEILCPPIKSIESLKSAYEKIKDNKNAFLLLLCDGLSGVEESIVTTLYFMDDTFKIIGGSAGDSCLFKETLIFIGNKRVNSVALFFDMKNKTEIIKENIYVPSGKKLLVTDADLINRTVRTFNNCPASSEYARVLGVSEKELPNYFGNNPLGKIYKDDILISSPMKVNCDKSITFYCQVLPNTFVHILTPVDPIKKIKETLGYITFKPQFTYVVNCILRSSKFHKDGLWNKIDKELLSICTNTTGFVSYGEQFHKHHVNQTMVILAVN